MINDELLIIRGCAGRVWVCAGLALIIAGRGLWRGIAGWPGRTALPCGDVLLVLPGFAIGCKSGSCGVAPFLFAGWSVWLSSFVSCAAGPRVVLSRFVLECKFTQNFFNMEIREGETPSRMPMFMYFSEFFRVKMEERGLQERQRRGGCGTRCNAAAHPT